MQLGDELRDSFREDTIVASDGLAVAGAAPEFAEEHSPVVSDAYVLDVLAAVAEMALRSKRRQADLDAAMTHAGLVASPARRLTALQRLQHAGCVDRVVELNDGGVLLSVTGLGLERLGPRRPG